MNKQQLPDARKHQIISFIKSGIRILGYALIPFSLVWATIVLVLSEVVGILGYILIPFSLSWATGVLVFSEVIGIVEELV